MVVGARDHDLAGFERLAQRIKYRSCEFGEFVEKQDAAMSEEISPGRARAPPPTSAAIEAEWCGSRNGRVWISPPAGSWPATE